MRIEAREIILKPLIKEDLVGSDILAKNLHYPSDDVAFVVASKRNCNFEAKLGCAHFSIVYSYLTEKVGVTTV